MRTRVLLTALVFGVGTLPAHALQLLTAGKVAVLRDKADASRDAALIRFGPNRALARLIDPTCAGGNPTAVKLSAYENNVVVTHLDMPLACEKWRATRGGFLYEDSGGAVRRIVYASNKLVVQLKEPGYTPVNNLFDFVGVVAPVIRPTDPLYAKVIQTVDFALAPENLGCLTEQPEICANEGMAPHNVEGALVLFGDLYAKGLVQDDPSPFRGADNLYRLANAFALASDWNPRFQTLAADRQATVAQRVALYANDDPADDPPLIGNSQGEACATCHHKR
jgi:hypothetical protein